MVPLKRAFGESTVAASMDAEKKHSFCMTCASAHEGVALGLYEHLEHDFRRVRTIPMAGACCPLFDITKKGKELHIAKGHRHHPLKPLPSMQIPCNHQLQNRHRLVRWDKME